MSTQTQGFSTPPRVIQRPTQPPPLNPNRARSGFVPTSGFMPPAAAPATPYNPYSIINPRTGAIETPPRRSKNRKSRKSKKSRKSRNLRKSRR